MVNIIVIMDLILATITCYIYMAICPETKWHIL